ADMVQDLAALGALATNLSSDTPDRSTERVLDGLRQVTEAEIAELFLVEPRGRDMLLTAFRGPFPSAFMEMTRFPIGQGFPGLVLSQGEPISTSDLLQESRYLRTRVKEKGFNSYVCQPLRGARGIIGVLNVAARRPDMDLERAQRLLSWVSVPLSAMLDAASLKARVNGVTTPPGAMVNTAGSQSELLRGVLRRMMAVGDAGAGALFLLDRDMEGLAQQVTEGAFDEAVCPGIQHGESRRCPALVQGHGMALYGPRYRWPSACQHVSARGSVVHCLPLISGEERIGIVQLRYAAGGLSPPTRYLATLLDMAEEAALAIKKARDNLQEQARAVALESQLQREGGRRTAHAKGLPDLSGPESPWSEAGPLQP
ncbi:MAG: GAF domain-containing protein, partial [Chloroflexota bacterium]